MIFEPTHFLAQYLPRYFQDLLHTLTPSCDLISFISSIHEFLNMTITFFNENYSQLLSFINQHFSLNFTHHSSSHLASSSNIILDDILHLLQHSINSKTIHLCIQMMAKLTYADSYLRTAKHEKTVEEIIIKSFLTDCQKLRFEVGIINMSMGDFSNSFEKVIQTIFCFQTKLCGGMKNFVKKIFLQEPNNISETTKISIIKRLFPEQQNLNINKPQSVPNVKKNLPHKSAKATYHYTNLANKRKNEEEEDVSESRKRMQEYSKLLKHKQIAKNYDQFGKSRTMYHMRKGTFVPKEGSNYMKTMNNQNFCQVFDFSTQNSSRSFDECPRINSVSELQIDSIDNEEEILVRETPQTKRKEFNYAVITRRLQFSED